MQRIFMGLAAAAAMSLAAPNESEAADFYFGIGSGGYGFGAPGFGYGVPSYGVPRYGYSSRRAAVPRSPFVSPHVYPHRSPHIHRSRIYRPPVTSCPLDGYGRVSPYYGRSGFPYSRY